MITEDRLIELTSIGGNIDMDKLRPFIGIALRTSVKPILGKALFDRIQKDFDEDTLTGKYLTIYNDYVEYLVAYYTAHHFITMHPFSIVNAGIIKNAPEDSETPDFDEITFLADRYKSLAWTIEQEFLTYVKDNKITEIKGSGCGKQTPNLRLNYKIQ